MYQLADICQYLEDFAPLDLAAEWDNVGLLVGRMEQPVSQVMTCLTVTPATSREAIQSKADLVISHHPLPFRPLKRITDETTAGKMLLSLLEAGIAIYSPHTAFDSTARGINQQLAERIGLRQIEPLQALNETAPHIGAGRFGTLEVPVTIQDLVVKLKASLKSNQFRLVGDPLRSVDRVAVACGSAGEFLSAAMDRNCQLMVTGETSFHTCLEAEARDMGLLLVGHYASERFALETLADELAREFDQMRVWASKNELDPLTVL